MNVEEKLEAFRQS